MTSTYCVKSSRSALASVIVGMKNSPWNLVTGLETLHKEKSEADGKMTP
jgi:hypothetical protein